MVAMVMFVGGALMDGKADDLNKFLSTLLNKRIDASSRISLSSAQQIKLYVWLREREIKVNEGLMKGSFKSSELINNSPRSTINSQEIVSNHDDTILSHRVAQIGVDIQAISEFYSGKFPIDPKADSYLKELFSIREISYAQSRPNTLQTLTGIFCAKEAIIKCAGGTFLDIEIFHDKYGRPTHPEYALSISHSNDYVVAIALRGHTFRQEQVKYPTLEDDFGVSGAKKLFVLKSIRLVDLFIFFGLILNFSILYWMYYKVS